MYIKREQELNSYEIFSFVFQAFLNILGNCMQAQYKHTPVKVNGESIQMHVYKNKKKVNWCFLWRRNKFIATVDWYCAQILGDCLHWRHVFFFSYKEYLLSFVNEIVLLHSENTCSTPVAYARFLS